MSSICNISDDSLILLGKTEQKYYFLRAYPILATNADKSKDMLLLTVKKKNKKNPKDLINALN